MIEIIERKKMRIIVTKITCDITLLEGGDSLRTVRRMITLHSVLVNFDQAY